MQNCTAKSSLYLNSHCRGVFFFSPHPRGSPHTRGIRNRFPSTRGVANSDLSGCGYFSPRPRGSPHTRGIRNRFPSTRGVACEAMTGWFLSPTPPYGHPSRGEYEVNSSFETSLLYNEQKDHSYEKNLQLF